MTEALLASLVAVAFGAAPVLVAGAARSAAAARPLVLKNAAVSQALRPLTWFALAVCAVSGTLATGLVLGAGVGIGVAGCALVTRSPGARESHRRSAASAAASFMLLVAETLAVVAALSWLFPGHGLVVASIVAALLIVAVATASRGAGAALQSIQQHAAVFRLAVFGVATVLLYRAVSSLAAWPPHGAASLAMSGAAAAALLIAGRTRFIDAHAIAPGPSARPSARVTARLSKIVNVLVSTALALVIVLAGMALASVAPGPGFVLSAAGLASPWLAVALACGVALGVVSCVESGTWLAAEARDAGLRMPSRGAAVDAAMTAFVALSTVHAVSVAEPGGVDALGDVTGAPGLVSAVLALLVVAAFLPALMTALVAVGGTRDGGDEPSSRRRRSRAVVIIVAVLVAGVAGTWMATGRALRVAAALAIAGAALHVVLLAIRVHRDRRSRA